MALISHARAKQAVLLSQCSDVTLEFFRLSSQSRSFFFFFYFTVVGIQRIGALPPPSAITFLHFRESGIWLQTAEATFWNIILITFSFPFLFYILVCYSHNIFDSGSVYFIVDYLLMYFIVEEQVSASCHWCRHFERDGPHSSLQNTRSDVGSPPTLYTQTYPSPPINLPISTP